MNVRLIRAHLRAGLLAALFACGNPNGDSPSVDGSTPGDTGCANPCDCCAPNEVCYRDQCCAPQCNGTTCGDDGCGGTCPCPEGSACNETNKICECFESEDDLCTRKNKLCGALTATDRCNVARQVVCSVCPLPKTCRPDDSCACDSEDTTAFCTRHGAQCGSVTGADNCDLTRTNIDCGDCNSSLTCVNNQCVCVPDGTAAFCAKHHATCGEVTGQDNCGATRTVDCGSCSSGETCNLTTHTCGSCQAESDPDFCRRHNKWCGAFTGPDNCGDTRAVSNCGTCPSARTCRTDGRCDNGSAPPNDYCDTPDVLVFDASGHAQAHGETSSADNSAISGGDCEGVGDGPDVVFLAHLTAASDMDVTLDATYGSGAYLVLHVRSHCADETTTLGCDEHSADSPGRVTLEGLPAGNYFIWVDGYHGDSGTFTLDVQVLPRPHVPQNDLCVAAEPLGLVSGSMSVFGSTRGALDDGTGSCATMGGGDVFYSFAIGADSEVIAVINADPVTPSYKPAAYLLDACGGGAAEKACGVGGASVASLPAGQYLVAVDGLSNTRGNFVLTLQVSAPTSNDNCSAPNAALPLTLNPQTRSVTVFGDTRLGLDDGASSCTTNTGKDLVYSYEIPAGSVAQDVTLVLAPPPGSAFRPLLYVRSVCGDESTQLGCKYSPTADTPARVVLEHQLPGTYFVWADTYSTYAGPFALSISTADSPPQPPNDVCAGGGATQVTLDRVTNPTVTQPGTTIGALNDSTGSCDSMSGGDVAYTFTLAASSRVTATVERDASTPSWKPAVYIVNACPAPGTTPGQPACASSSSSSRATAVARSLAVGTYYVIVDGLTADDGNFTLTLAADEPMDNDTCATARAILLDANGNATLAGDTTGLANDVHGAGACGGSGPDAVYSLTLATRKIVELVLTPLAFTDETVLHVRSTCNDQNTELKCQRGALNQPNRFTLSSLLPNIPYYIWVDGFSGGVAAGQGPFKLEVHAVDPQPPTNDTCSRPEALAIHTMADSSVTVSGSTLDATGDYMGGCRAATTDPSGGDVVYSFRLDQEKKVEVFLEPVAGSTLKPVVYLQSSSCGTGSELECSAMASVASAGFRVPFLPAGTYYLVVDSYGPADSGAFSLTVTTTAPPQPLPGDTCSTPIALTYDSAGNRFAQLTGATTDARDDYSGPCEAASSLQSGGDLVYKFTLPSDRFVAIKVTPDSASRGQFTPVAYVQTTCGSARSIDTIACGAGASPGDYTLNVSFLPAGTYYLVIDGVGGSRGGFTLDVTLKAPVAGDSCLNAIPITDLTPGVRKTVTADTTPAFNDTTSLGCGGTDLGRDIVYRFSTVGLGRQKLTANLAYDSSYSYPAMSLRTVCNANQASDEVACARRPTAGEGLTLRAMLEEGVYYLWVDQTNNSSYMPFQLALDLVAYVPPPANDVCASAESLGVLPPAGSVSRSASTTWANDDYRPAGCAPAAVTGGDVVYSFQLNQPAMVTATVTRGVGSGGYEPALYLKRDCAGTAPGDLVLCNAVATTPSLQAQVKAPTLAAGTWYLIVDGTDPSGGNFTLEVTTAPPVADVPENCASPFALQLDALGHGEVHGDTSTALNDTSCSTTCNSSGAKGPDLVYLLDTTALGTRDFLATIRLGTGFSSSVLSLRTDCAAIPSEVACKYSYGSTNTLAYLGLAPGIHYLWVAGASSSTKGTFDLTVDLYDPTQAVPANDLCANAQGLGFDPVTGDVRIRGTTAGGTGDPMSGSCATANGPEVVYTFTLSDAGAIYAAVSRAALTPSFEPNLHLRSSCPSTGSTGEVACAVQSSGVALLNKNLPAGRYYLVVDGTNNTSGYFELYVSVFDPVTNDGCSSARTLSFDALTGSSRLHSTTSLAANDTASNGCNSSGAGSDVVYRIDVPAGTPKDVFAEVSPLPYSGFRGVISLRTACGDRTTELGCTYTANANTRIAWKWPSLAAGTYYLWVDSYSYAANAGAFELMTTMIDHPAPPANDTCTGSIPEITFGPNGLATVPNALIPPGFIDDALDSGTGVACGTGATGPDVVYAFTLTRDQQVTVTLTPAATYAPTIYLRKTYCSSAQQMDEVGCATTTTAGTAVTIRRQALSQGTYYLWVDSGTGSPGHNWGGYQLDLALAAPVYPPTNDTCASPIALTLGQQVSGDTTEAAGDYFGNTTVTWSAACTGTKPKGHDVVYSFVPPANGTYTVTMIPAGWDALLWYSIGTCGSASACGAIHDTLNNKTLETLTLSGVTAGTTYYIYVSHYSASQNPDFWGAFTLVIN